MSTFEHDESKKSEPTSITALRILEEMTDNATPVGVTELAERLGFPKARVHRHLKQLREGGFVRYIEPTRQYAVGWRLLLLSRKAVEGSSIKSIVQPIAQRLRDKVGQTVVFSHVTAQGIVVMNVEPGGADVDIIFPPGTRFGFNAAAQGKIALAYGTPEQVKTWSANAPEIRTRDTLQSMSEVLDNAAEIRAIGWVSAPNETYLGINAIAAPVFEADGSILGTLALVGTTHLLPDPPSPELSELLTEAAAEISHAWGYHA